MNGKAYLEGQGHPTIKVLSFQAILLQAKNLIMNSMSVQKLKAI